MLEWIVAVSILIAVVLLWPASLHFVSRGQSSVRFRVTGKRNSGFQTGRPDSISDPPPITTGEGEAGALICKPSALAKYLQRHCATFREFAAAPWWSWRANPFWQTLAAVCWPSENAVRFIRDHLQVNDGGLVALDWAHLGMGGMAQKRRRTSSNSASPVLLVIPNSFGKITWNVLKLCELALCHGYIPVVFNRRGHNGTPLSTPRLQRFGDPADLREAVRYVRYRRPIARIYAASESTGCGLLLSYLGECGSSSYLTAAACISPVLRCQAWYESAPSWPYGWALLLYQKICLSRYRTALGDAVRTDAVFSSSSLRGLEEALFCQPKQEPKWGSASEGGRASWEEYWESNEPLRDVDEVAVPVLSVCSRDDPVRGGSSGATLPFDLFLSNPHLFLLLTEQGGHCGFAEPKGKVWAREVVGGAPWSHRAILEFFRSVTDFFVAEERAKAASVRRGLRGGASTGVGAVGNSRGLRNSRVSACNRLPSCSHSIHSIYCWQRSYTR